MAKLAVAPSEGRWRARYRVLLLHPLILAVMLGVSGAGFAQAVKPPLPPPRPDRPAAPAGASENPTDAEASKRSATPSNDVEAACLERIGKLGLRFEKRPPVQEGACTIGNPVSVSSLANGVELSPPSVMECRYAENLARWVGDIVAPRASEHLQSAPVRLLVGTSYQCRDQRSGSKLSEHAFGNGVDVMGFAFDKHPPLTIKTQIEGSPEDAFQSAIRKEACRIFTTVLGPGADADHGDHLHLDMRARKGDYRICQ